MAPSRFGGAGGRAAWGYTDSPGTSRIVSPEGAEVEVRSAAASAIHGARVHLAVLDELAQFPEGRGRETYGAIVTSLGKVPGGRLLVVSTRAERAGIWWDHLVESGTDAATGVVVADYSADPKLEWDDPEGLKQANPAYPERPDPKVIAQEIEAARKDPRAMVSYRAYLLNLGPRAAVGVGDVLVSADDLAQVVADHWGLSGPVWVGLDLGQSRSLTSGLSV